jgi:DNA processing protein
VTSPASAGCHRLLREFDAVCVTDAAQMAELVPAPSAATDETGAGDGPSRVASRATDELTDDERRVLEALGVRRARTIAELAERAKLGVGAVMGALGALEATGLARAERDGWVRRRSA